MGSDRPFTVNRAIIQKGETRMMVYYWFQQKDRRIASDVAAKFWLMMDGMRTGRTDGALVRLTTAMAPGESSEAAEARLQSALREMLPALPRFIPEG
jgi:EpsI family protein